MPRRSNPVPQARIDLRCNKHKVLGTSYREIGSKLCASTSGFSANTGGTGCSGDNDDLALKAEEVFELGSFGNGDRHVENMCRIRRGLDWLPGCNGMKRIELQYERDSESKAEAEGQEGFK
jgi:hypothetical protein